MITETYKGRKIRIVKGRGRDFGYSRVTLNGTELGKWQGDESKVQGRIRGSIDGVDAVGGINGDKYGVEWYAPGTFEVCENGHPKEIGGECLHSYCIERRPAPDLEEAPAAAGQSCPERFSGPGYACTVTGPHDLHQAHGLSAEAYASWSTTAPVTEYSVKIWYRSGAYEGAPHCPEELARKIFADAVKSTGVEFAELHGPSGMLVESKTPNEEHPVTTEPEPQENLFLAGLPLLHPEPLPPAPELPQEPEPTA